MRITENQLRIVVKKLMRERLEDYRQVLQTLEYSTRGALRENGLSDNMFAIHVMRIFEEAMKKKRLVPSFAQFGTPGMWTLNSYKPENLTISFWGWSPTSAPSGVHLELKIDESMPDKQINSIITGFLANPVIDKEYQKMSSYASGLADYVTRTGNYD